MEIRVSIDDKGYNIYLGEGLLKNVRDYFEKSHIKGKYFIITDSNVARLYLEDLISGLCLPSKVDSFIVEAGEKSKSLDIVSEIYSRMLEAGCNRDTIVIALGGGVVGDIAGFIAATYMRGVGFVQIPTSLLAQVDSSIGGKVAVNLNGYKNVVGAFYQPKAVVIDVNVLTTLSRREMISGIGEVIKYGLIKDYEFFKWIIGNLPEILKFDGKILLEMVHRSVSIKKVIVEKDERDNSIRRILNFGHTIGHGIETLNNFSRYNHGEAVIMGIMYESLMARNMGLIDNAYYQEILGTLRQVIKPVKFNNIEIEKILQGVYHDKKIINGDLVFVLPTSQGKVEVFEQISNDNIIACLKEGIEYDN